GTLFFNHLFPPFNDVRARRAILMALDQADYMRAYVPDDKMWKPLPGYFPPGTPLYNKEGGEILKGPRDLDGAKRLLAERGYAGEPIISMAAQDLAHHKAWVISPPTCCGDSASTSTMRRSTGARWSRAGRKNLRRVRAAGTFFTPPFTESTV